MIQLNFSRPDRKDHTAAATIILALLAAVLLLGLSTETPTKPLNEATLSLLLAKTALVLVGISGIAVAVHFGAVSIKVLREIGSERLSGAYGHIHIAFASVLSFMWLPPLYVSIAVYSRNSLNRLQDVLALARRAVGV